jgi:hypothetical protein
MVQLLTTGQAHFNEALGWVSECLDRYENVVVVGEKFTITRATAALTQQTEALEVIGAVRWECVSRGLAAPTLQLPAEAKRLVIDRRLKELGWWQPGKDHARDALRHLALWCTKNGWKGLPT